MVDQNLTGGATATKRPVVATPKLEIPTTPEPSPTSFGSLVSELNSPTSTVGRLNASKEWQDGFEACRRYVTRKRNPYIFGTIEHDEWHEGWRTRFHNGGGSGR